MQDEWLLVLITLFVFNVKFTENTFKILKQKNNIYKFQKNHFRNIMKYSIEASESVTQIIFIINFTNQTKFCQIQILFNNQQMFSCYMQQEE